TGRQIHTPSRAQGERRRNRPGSQATSRRINRIIINQIPRTKFQVRRSIWNWVLGFWSFRWLANPRLANPGGRLGSPPPRMGPRSGRAAARFLQKGLGYRILCRNFSCPRGELDLVALDGDCVVFVEVRSTEGEDCSRPAESVDDRKQRRLTELALLFLHRHRL